VLRCRNWQADSRRRSAGRTSPGGARRHQHDISYTASPILIYGPRLFDAHDDAGWLRDELRQRNRLVAELRSELDEANDVLRRFDEYVEDYNGALESWRETATSFAGASRSPI
jgi:hypothetical protein